MTRYTSKIKNHSIAPVLVGTGIGFVLSLGWFVFGRVMSLFTALLLIFGLVLTVVQKFQREWEWPEKRTAAFIIGIVILVIYLCLPFFPWSKTFVMGTLYNDTNGDGKQNKDERGIHQEKLILVSECEDGRNTEGVSDNDGNFRLEVPDNPPKQFCLQMPDRALAVEGNLWLKDHFVLHLGIHDRDTQPPWPSVLSPICQGLGIAVLLILSIMFLVLIIDKRRSKGSQTKGA